MMFVARTILILPLTIQLVSSFSNNARTNKGWSKKNVVVSTLRLRPITDNVRNKQMSKFYLSKNNNRVAKRLLPKKLVNIYVDYATRLWRDTDPEARKKIASKKATSAVKRVEHLMQGEEYVDLVSPKEGDTIEDIEERNIARVQLLEACQLMLKSMEKHDKTDTEIPPSMSEVANEEILAGKGKTKGEAQKKKKGRSVLFGAMMGGE